MKRNRKSLRVPVLVLAGALAGGMAACNVEQKEEGSLPDIDVSAEGNLELPRYSVNKTEEGRLPDIDIQVKDKGNLPKYDVTKTKKGNLPDVDVSARGGELPEFEIEGPEIEVEKKQKTITYPDVDVKFPKDGPADASDTE